MVFLTRALIAVYILLFLSGCNSVAEQTGKPHHTAKGFRNEHVEEKPGFLRFLRWQWKRLWKDIPPPESYDFPLAEHDTDFLRKNRNVTSLTWIGHATVLFQLDGKNVLTDPHFSKRASPVQWAGPERVVPPGIPLEKLPPIDIVVISHDHYDSLDKNSIRRLYEREGGRDTRFYVPLGLKKWFAHLGVERTFELDWWDELADDGLVITAVPVQHWSKRKLLSRNKTLWAGWVIRSKEFRLFFAGDSGYSPYFREVGQKFGPFDLSLIPIGAYEPRWFMKNHHMSPEEAVKVHQDVRSKKSVAVHWGTFILTDEPLDEPPERLVNALHNEGVPSEDFMILRHGETIWYLGSEWTGTADKEKKHARKIKKLEKR